MIAWTTFTWQDWDYFTWEQWRTLRMAPTRPELIESPCCSVYAAREAIDDAVGAFWRQFSPIVQLAGGLRYGVALYTTYLLDLLYGAAVGNCIDRAEPYCCMRRLLLPLDVGRQHWYIGAHIARIGTICNKADHEAAGAVAMLPDRDFVLENGTLRFLFDIERDNRFNQIQDGSSRLIVVWALDVIVRDDSLYRNFGAALGLNYRSDEYFRDLVKVLWDGLIGGFSVWHVFAIDAAVRRLPLCRFDGEKVTEIVAGPDGYIKTDRTIYDTAGYAPGVEVNDVLRIGQPLLRDHGFFDFGRGTVPDNIEGITVPAEMLSHLDILDYRLLENGDYRQCENADLRLLESDGKHNPDNWVDPPGALYLLNDDVPVTVNDRQVSWSVSDDPLVDQWFWSIVRALELKYGITLYDLLLDELGEIPDEINPAAFFAKYVFRGTGMAISLPRSPYESGESIPTLPAIWLVLYATPRRVEE